LWAVEPREEGGGGDYITELNNIFPRDMFDKMCLATAKIRMH
jgi:hypothetical protein